MPQDNKALAGLILNALALQTTALQHDIDLLLLGGYRFGRRNGFYIKTNKI